MIEATTRALATLRAMDAGPLSQGLSPENAAACLHQAIRPINPTSLKSAVDRSSPTPSAIAIIVPYGVFTTPIEWTAIAAASGSRVHLKAPSQDPALCKALAETFCDEGLEVSWSTDRALPDIDAIIAFGDDQTVLSIAKDHPDTRVVQYGHRFSIAFVGGNPEHAAGPLAVDIARYDGRGCMAPAAVFTTGDPQALMEAMLAPMAEMEQRYPRGAVDPSLGPEWRRRIGLARVLGQVKLGSNWAITVSPPHTFTPTALPRMVNIHPVDSLDFLQDLMTPFKPWLSTLGTDTSEVDLDGILRTCRLGWMQAPSIPRDHDGHPMLSGL